MQLPMIGFPGKVNTLSLTLGAGWKIAGSAGQARNMPQKKKGAEAADFKPPAELTGSPKAKPDTRPSFQRCMTH